MSKDWTQLLNQERAGYGVARSAVTVRRAIQLCMASAWHPP